MSLLQETCEKVHALPSDADTRDVLLAESEFAEALALCDKANREKAAWIEALYGKGD